MFLLVLRFDHLGQLSDLLVIDLEKGSQQLIAALILGEALRGVGQSFHR